MSWKFPKGYYTVDRATQAVLVNERCSTQVLFNVLVSQAITHRIDVRQPDGGIALWPAGSRPWGLRELAATARMSVATIRRGLERLTELGFIRRVSNKLGTVVQVLKFFQFRRRNANADAGVTAEENDPLPEFLTHRGGTPSASVDPYRSSSSIIKRSLPSPVAVPARAVQIEPWKPEPGTIRRMFGAWAQ